MSDHAGAARADMDALLDALMRFAQEMLDKHGEFYPFAAVVTNDGDLQMVSAYSETEHPPSQELIDLLHARLRDQARGGEIRAAGVCVDVRVRSPHDTDAIQASLEHRDADPVNVFLPYRKRRLGDYDYGELFATAADRRVF